MPYPSRTHLGVAFGVLLALPLLMGTVRTSGTLIVPPGDVVGEDLYVLSQRTIIEGVVQGDLVVISGELVIDGTVEGDVLGLVGGRTRITGAVFGSVRVATVGLEVSGTVGEDAAALAVETDISGSVGRDALVIAGELGLSGSVGRDVRGQARRMAVDGAIARNVEVRVDELAMGSSASVGGDLVFEASRPARVADGARIEGQMIRRQTLTPIWARAVARVFGLLSLLGLVVAGLIGQWLFRGTSERALGVARERPGKAALVGLGALLVPPILVLPLFLTLVGIPVAVVLLLLWATALFLGPLPAVTAVGHRLLQGRGGAAAGLVLGALLWRGAMWLLPLIAGLLYLAALLVGLGSYFMAGWDLRGEHAA